MSEKLHLVVDQDSTSDELKIDLYLVHAPMSSARFVVEDLSSDITSIHYIPAEDPLNPTDTYITSPIVIKDAAGNTDAQTYDSFASFDVDPGDTLSVQYGLNPAAPAYAAAGGGQNVDLGHVSDIGTELPDLTYAFAASHPNLVLADYDLSLALTIQGNLYWNQLVDFEAGAATTTKDPFLSGIEAATSGAELMVALEALYASLPGPESAPTEYMVSTGVGAAANLDPFATNSAVSHTDLNIVLPGLGHKYDSYVIPGIQLTAVAVNKTDSQDVIDVANLVLNNGNLEVSSGNDINEMYLLGELRFGLDGSQATTDFKIDGIQFSANLGEDAGTKEALDEDASGNPTYLNFTHVEPALEVSASFQEGSWSLAAGLENEGDHQDSDHQDDNTQNDNTQQNQGPLYLT